MFRLVQLIPVSLFGFAAFAMPAQARIDLSQTPTSVEKQKSVFSKNLRSKIAKPQKAKAAITIERRRAVGYVMELVVGCPSQGDAPRQSGIISYSKLEKTFCEPNRVCHRTAISAAASICKISTTESSLKLNRR